ncbi:hypothetical protein QFZ22_002470 [Streptomyces canus]|uniref:Uncharacterized protein n=1 Tax=Streptomyces canus TaxID=58343 RepID=A0AAW8FBE8_9ACTN|nr:hypothetical protein [Streptomyces canus]
MMAGVVHGRGRMGGGLGERRETHPDVLAPHLHQPVGTHQQPVTGRHAHAYRLERHPADTDGRTGGQVEQFTAPVPGPHDHRRYMSRVGDVEFARDRVADGVEAGREIGVPESLGEAMGEWDRTGQHRHTLILTHRQFTCPSWRSRSVRPPPATWRTVATGG